MLVNFMSKIVFIVIISIFFSSGVSFADPFDECDQFSLVPTAHQTCLDGVRNRLMMQTLIEAKEKQNRSNPLYGCSFVSEIEADTVEEANALANKIGGNRIQFKLVTKTNVRANVYKCP